MSFRYPCTGHVDAQGFGAWVEAELGPPRRNLSAFHGELCESFGCEFLTLTNSGSSANLAAMFAAREFRPTRPRAIAAGFTFPTTLSALVMAGWDVELVDTEADGFCMDPDALERRLGGDVGLLCVTHFLGFPGRLDRIADLATQAGALLVQDGCDTMAMKVGGRPIHAYGDLVTHSFYHPHHLPAHGGGAVCSNDPELGRIVESVVHWGRACSHQAENLPCALPDGPAHFFTYERPGFNLQMSELNACFGRFQNRNAEDHETRRLTHYGLLRDALRSHSALRTWDLPDVGCTPGVFPLRLLHGSVDGFVTQLADRGVETRTLLGGTIADQAAFSRVRHDGLEECRKTSARTLMVGIHQTLEAADVAEVGRILAEEATQ